jgi:hypothetical protein
MKLSRSPLCAALVVAQLLFWAGCGFHSEPSGPVETLPVSVELGSAERSKLEINLPAGELTVQGGSAKLLDGSLSYRAPAKPEINTALVGGSTDITIKSPEHRFGGNPDYRWNLQVNNQVLLDLSVNCGAGQQHLQLGDLKLRSVNVQLGAGQVDLNLRGHPPTRDYDVVVSGGVGQANVTLPRDVGIWAEAHGGIGHIEVQGLEKRGDHWENNLYDSARVNVHVRVNGGVGEIRLIAN